jgi:hypothetical protein
MGARAPAGTAAAAGACSISARSWSRSRSIINAIVEMLRCTNRIGREGSRPRSRRLAPRRQRKPPRLRCLKPSFCTQRKHAVQPQPRTGKPVARLAQRSARPGLLRARGTSRRSDLFIATAAGARGCACAMSCAGCQQLAHRAALPPARHRTDAAVAEAPHKGSARPAPWATCQGSPRAPIGRSFSAAQRGGARGPAGATGERQLPGTGGWSGRWGEDGRWRGTGRGTSKEAGKRGKFSRIARWRHGAHLVHTHRRLGGGGGGLCAHRDLQSKSDQPPPRPCTSPPLSWRPPAPAPRRPGTSRRARA